jgi:hypothetical protein
VCTGRDPEPVDATQGQGAHRDHHHGDDQTADDLLHVVGIRRHPGRVNRCGHKEQHQTAPGRQRWAGRLTLG